jgi:cell wall-associated NlpC family hydrolase
MSVPRPHAAVVSTAVLDVRRRPDHRSELSSQLLLGETVRVLGGTRDRLWWRIENDADRYRGWVRAWGLAGASPRRVRGWIALARGRIVAPVVTATTRPGGEASVAPLYWNSRVIPRRSHGRWRHVELPSGARGWVPRRAVEVGRGARMGLGDRVRGLLGVPYLWGGRTARGIDCSGLTQQLLAEQGVGVPRDAAHQYRASRRLQRGEEPRAGDLVFFADRSGRVAHVGLMLGESYYVQSRGAVRLSSIHNDNALYDKELEGTLVGIRRP